MLISFGRNSTGVKLPSMQLTLVSWLDPMYGPVSITESNLKHRVRSNS